MARRCTWRQRAALRCTTAGALAPSICASTCPLCRTLNRPVLTCAILWMQNHTGQAGQLLWCGGGLLGGNTAGQPECGLLSQQRVLATEAGA